MEGVGADLGAATFAGSWALMMAAMMLPSMTPVVALYDRMRLGHALGAEATAAFVAGYLATWVGAGLTAFALVKAGDALLGETLAWDEAGRWVAGAVVLVAAAYQLSPLKDRCLRHCRSPLGFLLSHWRDGRAGALKMGATHGAWCVGCCWGLMATLFAVGLMSIGWMAAVAGLIAIERLAPGGSRTRYGVAAALAVLGPRAPGRPRRRARHGRHVRHDDEPAPDADDGPVAWAADRARRGISGALYSQSALARPNSLSRGSASGVSSSPAGVDGPGPARCRPVNQVRSGRKQP